MADETKRQQAQRRSRAAAEREEAAADEQRADEPQEDDAAAAEQETSSDEVAGPQTPPPPPTPKDAPASGGDTFPKDALVARADTLLGVSPAVARGALAEEGDDLTVDDAKRRIQRFLDNPVNPPEEA